MYYDERNGGPDRGSNGMVRLAAEAENNMTDVIIFDMDGVLVEVSASYRKAIQRTVRIYLESCLGFQRDDSAQVTDRQISLLKSAGGFNNDWDLTAGVLLYLLSRSSLKPCARRTKCSSIDEVLSCLGRESRKCGEKKALHLDRRDFTAFIERVKGYGGGLEGLRRSIRDGWDGWVYHSGEIDRTNLVKRIFQEVYLGERFFPETGLRPLFEKRSGLYLEEKPIIPQEILSALHKRARMGIASGRPRSEAEFALKRFELFPYFESLMTLEDCEEEEGRIYRTTGDRIGCSKPHPFSLLKAVRALTPSPGRCFYVGDVVDDMRAARSAKQELDIVAVGFLFGRKREKESLYEAGADIVVESPRELLTLFDKEPKRSPARRSPGTGR
jgi:HAD superfamily phosphatase